MKFLFNKIELLKKMLTIISTMINTSNFFHINSKSFGNFYINFVHLFEIVSFIIYLNTRFFFS